MNTCVVCGGNILGDGYTVPLHCENVECPDTEPDANTTYCKETKMKKSEHAAALKAAIKAVGDKAIVHTARFLSGAISK